MTPKTPPDEAHDGPGASPADGVTRDLDAGAELPSSPAPSIPPRSGGLAALPPPPPSLSLAPNALEEVQFTNALPPSSAVPFDTSGDIPVPLSVPPRAERPSRRPAERGPASLGAIVLIVLAVIGLLAFLRASRPPAPEADSVSADAPTPPPPS